MVAREGLGYWDFVDLDTDRGRVLIGQPQGLRIAAALWCERDLSPKEIREFCEGLFQTKVRVMNPDTGEIW